MSPETASRLMSYTVEATTTSANNAPRLTHSRRYRRWRVVAVRAAVLAPFLILFARYV